MFEPALAHLFMIAIFAIGYAAIIFEHSIKVNKSASALTMAVLTWMFLYLAKGESLTGHVEELSKHLGDVSQIIFFLLGAMTLVELIDSHKGFRAITDLIRTSSKKKMLWIIGFVAFFLSAVLDNLTTTIVMISLLRKLVEDAKDRMLLGGMVVIAANAGGAWTPIGDITTTMLWINGNISTFGVMKSLFLPSFLSLAAALLLIGASLKGRYSHAMQHAHEEAPEHGSRLVFYCGLGGLIFVPIFKALTGMPPFMGMLISLGVLWILTDRMHHGHEKRQHLLVTHVLTRIDTSSVLFFFGILLCVGSLAAVGILQDLAHFLQTIIPNFSIIAILIGLFSAVIDNVPLVAAGMNMWDLQAHPPDSLLWQMLAYCAGTGGSILIIGSTAGVAYMGMEKVNFFWYIRKISLAALVSYLVGVGIYLLQEYALSF